MPIEPVPMILRYAWLFILLGVGFTLLRGRSRAAPLVAAGKVSEEELSGFVRGAVLLFGTTFGIMFLLQTLAGASDPFCLLRFPPEQLAGWLLWTTQAFLSTWLVVWVWAKGGDDLLARLAPAFTQGPVLERTFSATRVRYLVTAAAVLGPGGNLVMQLLSGAIAMPGCAAG